MGINVSPFKIVKASLVRWTWPEKWAPGSLIAVPMLSSCVCS